MTSMSVKESHEEGCHLQAVSRPNGLGKVGRLVVTENVVELGLHVGKIQQYSNYNHEGQHEGEAYAICISGERVVDMFDKVALPYKNHSRFSRKHCDSHCSFIARK